MRIIVADSQAIFRTGIGRICDEQGSIEVVALCADLAELQASVRDSEEAIVLFGDGIAPDLHGVIEMIQRRNHRSVMILDHETGVNPALLSRVDGVLLRSAAAPQLLDCLRRVAGGNVYRQRAVVRSMPSSHQAGANAVRKLTQRELQIVALVSDGYRNKEIGEQLGTGEQVVKNHLRVIYGKTGTSDRLQLAILTHRHRALAQIVEEARLGLRRIA